MYLVDWHIHFMRGFTCTEVGWGARNLKFGGLSGRCSAASAAETCDVTRCTHVGCGACRLDRNWARHECVCWPVRQGVTGARKVTVISSRAGDGQQGAGIVPGARPGGGNGAGWALWGWWRRRCSGLCPNAQPQSLFEPRGEAASTCGASAMKWKPGAPANGS